MVVDEFPDQCYLHVCAVEEKAEAVWKRSTEVNGATVQAMVIYARYLACKKLVTPSLSSVHARGKRICARVQRRCCGR